MLKIYDIIGNEVESIEQKMEKGEQNIKFTSDNLSSEVYIYTLIANNYRASKKMIILE